MYALGLTGITRFGFPQECGAQLSGVSWDVCEAVRHGWLPPHGADEAELPDGTVLFQIAREFLCSKQVGLNRTVELQHVRLSVPLRRTVTEAIPAYGFRPFMLMALRTFAQHCSLSPLLPYS